MSFLQIASWNIEHLGGTKRKDRKQSAFALAEHIEMAGVDAIVLQEVYVTPSDEEVRLQPQQPPIPSSAFDERRNRELDIVCYLLEEHLDTEWSYHILRNRNAGDKEQLCAVLWNRARLTHKGARQLDVEHQDGGDWLWDRTPHVVSFSSEIRVWRKDEAGDWEELDETRTVAIVPLHMKSNFGGVTKNRRVRGKEAETLCKALAAIEDELDPTLVLVGDTNVLDNREPAIETFVDAGFVDLNNNDSATYWSQQYGESPFDRFFVKEGRPEFRYMRQYVLKSSDLQQHDRFLSDHFMIKASIKDYLDDADPR